ncbi:uncharacterized protein LOC141689665 [Apium graveolens]|uniref:uncharacterized protein LOC141689665 n=1 Tax=Apium graveolens TaxID=4045 RepID=UPI003D7AF492
MEYSDDVEPVVDHVDEDTNGRERPRLGNQVVPHAHRSGRAMDERRRVENIQNQDEEIRDFSTLKWRLGIRLEDDDLRMLLLEWQKEGNGGEARPRDTTRVPPTYPRDDRVTDLAQYRLLATTFREGAQKWFQKLGPGKEGEILTSYFKRFNAESTLVRGATDETLKILLIAGLRVGTDFWKHLQGKDPVSLADVLAQAESFKAIEQSLAEIKKNDNTHNSKGRAKRRDRSASPDYQRNARSPNRRVSNYTPLEASIDHIFEVNKDRGIFKKPDHLTSWKSRDKKKYCEYHESTEEAATRGQEEDVEKTAEVQFQRAGSIRAFFGGHPFFADSNLALERNAREARHPPLTNIYSLEDRPPKIFKGESADITFRERESRWVHHPHNDALVINILIGAINVHRVFLDNGSSTNILNYSTYKKLGFPDSDLNFEDAHVYGFTGEAVRVMCSVRLPVTLGEGALSITQMIDFKVLDQDSAHNVLVGRP